LPCGPEFNAACPQMSTDVYCELKTTPLSPLKLAAVRDRAPRLLSGLLSGGGEPVSGHRDGNGRAITLLDQEPVPVEPDVGDRIRHFQPVDLLAILGKPNGRLAHQQPACRHPKYEADVLVRFDELQLAKRRLREDRQPAGRPEQEAPLGETEAEVLPAGLL